MVAICSIAACAWNAAAATGQWRVLKPSNTGIPGELVQVARFAPTGELWVAARWTFWPEGGIGIYDFATQIWTTHANWETPIPSELINDIEFAPDGTAWIATDRGLLHWDLVDGWTVYKTTNSPLLHNRIRNIAVDSQGVVWINNTNPQNQTAALFRFDGSTWRRFAVPTDLPWADPWRQLSDVCVDANDHVWVANATLNGVARYDGTTWTLHGAGLGRFGKLAADAQGNLWLIEGSLGYTFYRFNGASFTAFSSVNTPFVNTTVTSFGMDDDGTLYVGNWAGQVIKTTNSGQTWTPYLSGLNTVYSIIIDPFSTDVWIATIGAVGQFSASGQWLRDFNTWNTGMPDYFVDYMSADSAGMFWLATGEAGLSRFDGLRWRNWGNHNVGAEPYPFAGNEPMGGAFEIGDGDYFFGGNGIARWQSETGQFSGFWNWQNNPGMGVTLFPFFARDAAGTIFAADEYGAVFRFNVEEDVWLREPVQPYAGSGLPGMVSDSAGNVWVAAWFDIHKWDCASWSTVTLPYRDYFFDLGGINCVAVGPDDSLWLGTVEGMVRWDGVGFTLFDPLNSPLPARSVQGIAFREDGLMALSASDFQSTTPFPNGVAVIDGAIDNPADWSVWSYGDSPIPHYQLGRLAFDPEGDLWVSAISEGVAILDLPPPGPAGDLDGDGDVDISDLGLLLANYGLSGPGIPGDIDGDEDVDITDLGILLVNFGVVRN